ncbi:hypothetical protein A6X21_19770 [Planctopirus hydrillae]|uniref:Uncharacterized protein n=1 Tax=Planctopirus hydrillae TaxID=1841610 RepID=A0A1C3EHB4_9PLAN|nr:hypothetical protein A6X21_19770 [Planctopirus hydrillae]
MAGQVRERKAALSTSHVSQCPRRMVDVEACFSFAAWITREGELIPHMRSMEPFAIPERQRGHQR